MEKSMSELEKAQLVINKEKEERSNKCLNELKELLKNNNCNLIIVHSVNENNQILSNIEVVAL